MKLNVHASYCKVTAVGMSGETRGRKFYFKFHPKADKEKICGLFFSKNRRISLELEELMIIDSEVNYETFK
jgi:hypothetical protein